MNRTLAVAALTLIVLLLGAATHAVADTAIVYGTSGTATDTVTVKATINSMLTLSVDTSEAPQLVDFGTVNPGTPYGPKPVNLTVQSNRTYDISISEVGTSTIGLTRTLGNSTSNGRTAGSNYTDNYSINVPWTTAPGSYTATVRYTVVQN